jgi:hypothetical protein
MFADSLWNAKVCAHQQAGCCGWLEPAPLGLGPAAVHSAALALELWQLPASWLAPEQHHHFRVRLLASLSASAVLRRVTKIEAVHLVVRDTLQQIEHLEPETRQQEGIHLLDLCSLLSSNSGLGVRLGLPWKLRGGTVDRVHTNVATKTHLRTSTSPSVQLQKCT